VINKSKNVRYPGELWSNKAKQSCKKGRRPKPLYLPHCRRYRNLHLYV